jgi:hypothetical protein
MEMLHQEHPSFEGLGGYNIILVRHAMHFAKLMPPASGPERQL